MLSEQKEGPDKYVVNYYALNSYFDGARDDTSITGGISWFCAALVGGKRLVDTVGG